MLFKIDMGTEKDSLYFDAKDMQDAKSKAEDYYKKNSRPGQPAKRGELRRIEMTKMAAAAKFQAQLAVEAFVAALKRHK